MITKRRFTAYALVLLIGTTGAVAMAQTTSAADTHWSPGAASPAPSPSAAPSPGTGPADTHW
ncbi:hypothetical protein [Sphaerimonospora mesophila]|uniref:hypothetical protein n=1 Tax=Sphaerimonospora mesophila TaxID=37483 RepID=UPI0006E3619B